MRCINLIRNCPKWLLRAYLCWSVCVDISAAVLLIWYILT